MMFDMKPGRVNDIGIFDVSISECNPTFAVDLLTFGAERSSFASLVPIFLKKRYKVNLELAKHARSQSDKIELENIVKVSFDFMWAMK
jgi:hypothetical protein